MAGASLDSKEIISGGGSVFGHDFQLIISESNETKHFGSMRADAHR
jgi:hypothetical protein